MSQSSAQLNTLKCPAIIPVAAKVFADLPKIKGVGAHFKWLAKQLENEKQKQDCFISPFPSKVGLAITTFLGKHVPDYRSVLTGNNDTQALRDKLRESAALGFTAKHVYHGTTSYGMMQVQLLIKGEYVVFGGKSEFFPGDTLKQMVDKLITGDSGTLLKQAKESLNENVWLTRHQTPGTMMIIPSGHIFVMVGNHDSEKSEICSCLQWSYLDTTSKVQHTACCNMMQDMMQSYVEMNDADHQAWLRYLQALPVALS